MSNLILFPEITDSHHSVIGGKAASLGRLSAAGFSVPTGFVIPTSVLESAIEAHGLAAHFAGLDDLKSDAIAALRDKIVSLELPSELRDTLRQQYQQIFPNDAPVAVRSSGTKEDMERASFAGQYRTYLNVVGVSDVEEAIRQCWASLIDECVIDYAKRQAGGATDMSMAVVVQHMVDAEVSGVLFTIDPLTGHEDQMIIESAFGLGEGLVSGRVDADQFTVDARAGSIVHERIVRQTMHVVRAADGSTREEPLDPERGSRPTLTAEQVRMLSEIGARIQEHYGRPMDIEWAYADGAFHILQARPVTQVTFASDIGEWTTADFRDGGVAADVCTPLMASLYEQAFQSSMARYMRKLKLMDADEEFCWIRTFYARPYWNLGATKELLSRIPGFHERNFDLDLGISPTYDGDGRVSGVTATGLARAIPVLFALRREFDDCLRRNREFVAEFPRHVERFDLSVDELRTLADDRFADEIRALICDLHLHTEGSYFTTIYNTSNAKLEFKSQFDKANRAAGGTLDFLAMIVGLRDLSHLRPFKDLHRRLDEMAQTGRSIDDDDVRTFANRWKHHSRRELDISVPCWDGDHEHVREIMEQAQANFDPTRGPEETEAEQAAAYHAERHKAIGALRWRPLKRRAFTSALERCRSFTWWREEMRDHSSFVYYLIHKWAKEAGRRLVARGFIDEVDEVFYFPLQQLVDVLRVEDQSGAQNRPSIDRPRITVAEARAIVRDGRRTMASFRNFRNPNELGAGYRFTRTKSQAPAGDCFRGNGCSPGRYEGTARIITHLDDIHRVQAGDILVTVFTDPGWTSVFARLGAVVTETGGMLSHAAVIAREYGLPAVLAVSDITTHLRDGERIAVDGNSGTVERLS